MYKLLLIVPLVFIQACSSLANIDTQLKESVLADMVLVQAGSFEMGAKCQPEKKCVHPQHSVTLGAFYIGKYEVTQALFDSVLGASHSYFVGDNYPVNNLSWQQAKYFISQLNIRTGLEFRLPTEAEWEYAARGGQHSKNYTFSGSNNIEDVAWFAKNSNNKAQAVGLKAPSELGLYDMTGNVGEMTEDAYDTEYYRYSPEVNPVNSLESKHYLAYKSVRGGSFAYDADESENFRRDSASQSAVMPDIGLRLALSVE
ncbi:formylglycine-generating enzyme family protein [Shewanella eurypsychrophilus]|uniref:Formylglycine-generating enzyme family protein n=1 Tax=Shewanella eurypsychrophilus TaxID=2593656 RepID=A0ABX6VDC9_9GAMM|nr:MULTISPECIES: SUMF1/EgtB/PvdO family nonheme iron enzyme [Shewanella]QFU23287.1 SUMF1/EgtB/PvdO family nonheme iron enzyme [Shewanella sp. YLB-09]QPG58516.1 formylglycine-generating enzyme family protein [Shewanella eurypsychrophilus]